jgi:probable rRNA maturation factor
VGAIQSEVHVSQEDSRWDTILDEPIKAFIETYVSAALNHSTVAPNLPATVEISIVLTNDAEIQVLNHEYRGKDKPTNVLSFPQETDFDALKHLETCVLLGDIVLSIETIQREVDQQQKLMHHHLAHLIIHSALHLVGYDHETDSDAEKMEALEIDILHQYTIPNPYESDNSHMVYKGL